jgi:hypothetical protein
MRIVIELEISRPEGDDMGPKFKADVIEDLIGQIESLGVYVKDEEMNISDVTAREVKTAK